MNTISLLEDLNDKQKEAVSSPVKNMLILAGAGSGKTRVLVQRIAWLVAVERASPFSILAVTFTNKAALEMRERIDKLTQGTAYGMWNGTFHGICHRMLRAHYLDAKLPEDFQILDSEDQLRFLRRIIKAQNLDEKQWPAKQARWWINEQKDEGLRPHNIYHDNNPITKTWMSIYKTYQEACDRSGLVDFAEILLRSYELLRENDYIRKHYQDRFKHILVDEFQDTNSIQYAWLYMMTGDESRVIIVGDDDQSIYGWRGAKIENLQKFRQDFTDVVTIKLEQNYRSTKNILQAANALISQNKGRLGKELWTEGHQGDPISVYASYNELDEARFIASKISNWKSQGKALKDTAILYRNNAQSRVLEEALIQSGIAYKIYGGMRFFERQEIKDVLAYLRLVSNRQDDAAFERVVNTPTRGLGNKTLEIIREFAREMDLTMWESSITLLNEGEIKGRAYTALNRFIQLINALEDNTVELSLYKKTDYAVKHSGLLAMYQQEKGEKAQSRVENIEELVTAARQFDKSEDGEMNILTAFLTHAALESGEEQASEFDDAVQLMTLHSAKGLEFPLVFMSGAEEGMFPSQMSAEEMGRLEEERRLCYVGITRAMEKLYITYAETRRVYGQDKYHSASRFIKELPQECIDDIRMKTQYQHITNNSELVARKIKNKSERGGFELGQKVVHPKFGEGVIVNFEGEGEQRKIQVAFNGKGIKLLVEKYAKLEALDK